MPREVISVHIGQFGSQFGTHCWDLFGREHGLSEEGRLVEPLTADENDAMLSCYSQSSGNVYSPRALFVDLDPFISTHVKRSSCGKLMRPESIVVGGSDAAGCYGRGCGPVGQELLVNAMDSLRQLAGACDQLQGFVIHHAVSGGTGSGFGSLLMERIKQDFPKQFSMGFTLFASPAISSSPLVPYNTTFVLPKLAEFLDLDVVFDNESIYSICKNKLGISKPSYTHVNHLIAQIASSVTAPIRFGGDKNVRLDEFKTNLVVGSNQNLKFVLPAFSPAVRIKNATHERPTTADITAAAFQPSNYLALCNLSTAPTLASCLLYRGAVVVKEVNAVIASIKAQGLRKFVSWNADPIRHGINYKNSSIMPDMGMAAPDRTVVHLENNLSIVELFSRLDHKFDIMFAKRAFLSRYIAEGTTEGEFSEAREQVAALEATYEEASHKNTHDNNNDE